jgi:endonuclease/exonuclease/phosphatase family metal-dependent hydrolase
MSIVPPSIIGTFDTITHRLTPVPDQQRLHFLDLPLTQQGHAEAHAQVPAFHEVERGGNAETASRAGKLCVAAWNLERCLYPDAAAQLLRRHGVGLVLLTEMDCGMLRTGQVHTIADIAARLGQHYAYGLEFFELKPMPPPAGFATIGDDNDFGFHGNGLITTCPFDHPVAIRLDSVADWYIAPKGGQRRVGNRMAVAAVVALGTVRFVACSVHLESATDGAGRLIQMHTLLDRLDEFAAGLPVLIGGDLNTHVQPGGSDDVTEPLFALAKARGYDFSACNLASPTTRTSIWSDCAGTRQLDWFCTRDLAASEPQVVPALGPDGTVLSDHELILVSIG